ncbi:Ubiquitin carboxyl-terminal hydrolase 25 [Vitis vinifera]|uniref:ubiquitinyl hydrolase 1 n=1 Tax=Vitis vinifera TaxID=29760 RepID=A0A438I7L8_VITVI|nr:Ubiquitin carboxyl-terminal hydrolase 25 [Vitis vinifera]
MVVKGGMKTWKDGAKVGWKGGGFHDGWLVLVEKLHSLGVVPSFEARRVGSLARAKLSGFSLEKVRCEAGRIHCVDAWSIGLVRGGGGLKISGFGDTLLLFYFEDLVEAERVFARGLRRVKERMLHLVRWTPKVGCLVIVKLLWVASEGAIGYDAKANAGGEKMNITSMGEGGVVGLCFNVEVGGVVLGPIGAGRRQGDRNGISVERRGQGTTLAQEALRVESSCGSNVLFLVTERCEGGSEPCLVASLTSCLGSRIWNNQGTLDSHPEYNLFATIVHSGYSPESGHYYAYIKDAMGRWYCCNDSYVSLSTLQGVLSEKNRDCNGNNTSKNPRTALPVKTRHTKQNVEHSSGMDTSTISKVDKVPSSLQIKSNSFEKTVSKRVLATGNGKLDVHKNQILEKNGDVVEKSEKGTPSLANSNGFSINKRVDAADSVNGFVSANENDKLQNISGNSGKVDLYEGNVVKSRMTAEGRSNFHEVHNGGVKCPPGVSGVKRKSQDKGSCILLAQDAHSLAKVEEFKDGMKLPFNLPGEVLKIAEVGEMRVDDICGGACGNVSGIL